MIFRFLEHDEFPEDLPDNNLPERLIDKVKMNFGQFLKNFEIEGEKKDKKNHSEKKKVLTKSQK